MHHVNTAPSVHKVFANKIVACSISKYLQYCQNCDTQESEIRLVCDIVGISQVKDTKVIIVSIYGIGFLKIMQVLLNEGNDGICNFSRLVIISIYLKSG